MLHPFVVRDKCVIHLRVNDLKTNFISWTKTMSILLVYKELGFFIHI